MSDAPADTAPTTDAPADQAPATDAPDFSSLADLGLTPEQIVGRLEASRKWEERAKANATAAKEFERVQRESLPEQERLVAEAKAAARAEVLAEVGGDRVRDAIRVATAGRAVDVEALLEGLDPSRFVAEDGQPDTAGIGAWVDRIAPKAAAELATPWPDLGQGATSTAPLNSTQLERDLKSALGI
ncbi:hypothetical protein KSP35_13085 [Aquihabitans sp. G128]|uniref:hypothetical protein n=1 Tax=Aquihabitans sp. G128 TaxID=2849779 RepID=UPI001C23AFDA|nr:hypothetical protein [Aquihabitans sp. G128]QXC59337.1 hypothetical protein KSP35_13085 [Aquihabitans sp. G128]